MKLKLVSLGIGLIVALMVAGQLTSAQDTAKKTSHQKVRTVTGCLQKTEYSDEDRLTTKAWATWESKSDSGKFARHDGHTVTVTGVEPNATLHGLKEDSKTEARKHGVDKDSTEHGHLTVAALKMVSSSCSQ